jgi:poly-gamma-glutamate capsule biosynthesis protein CapA/YwtB (metallophosphatase superfamily)
MDAGGAQPATVVLAGDVMTGRGIDQILPHPNDPRLHERFVADARQYVQLAEAVNGPIPRPVDPAYPWGDALAELQRIAPAARVVNLETSVTASPTAWPKGINYRMHPANVGCLRVARIDVCALANNHTLDYGYAGLRETLDTLAAAGIGACGAGRTLAEAYRPAVVGLDRDRSLIVHAFGTLSSGIPPEWAAAEDRPGVALLPDLSAATATALGERMRAETGSQDLLIASIHWGSNWGDDVPRAQVQFAHRLIESGVDIVHGHSSHHPRPIEVYRRRLILYGCGDLINDYEGIRGYKHYRPDLALLYAATLDPVGDLRELRMAPLQIRRMRLNRAAPTDARWLAERLTQVSRGFGTWVDVDEDNWLVLRW